MALIDFNGTQTAPLSGPYQPAAPTAPPPNYPPMTPEPTGPPPGGPGGGAPPPFYQNDPGYMGAVAYRDSQLSNLQALLSQMTKQAEIRFGDFNNSTLDAATRALAKENYLSGNSTMSRLDHSQQLALSAILNQQAAHGMLGSGDTGYKQGQENTLYGNQVYDARNQLLDYLTGQQQNYLQQKSALDQYVQQAMQQAYQNYISDPSRYTGAGGSGLGYTAVL